MTSSDLNRDRIHKSRVDDIMTRFRSGDSSALDGLFVSEKVDLTLAEEKIFLPSYSLEKILSYLPFQENIYALICPYCVKKQDLEKFKILIERGVVVPTLLAPYKAYSEDVSDIIYSHDHMSRYEYVAFRYLSVLGEGKNNLCPHCVGEWKKETKSLLKSSPELERYAKAVDRLTSNIHPYVKPDSELLDEFKAAAADSDAKKLRQIIEMSEVIYAIRSAQAFRSPVLLSEKSLSDLPTGLTSEMDQAVALSANLDREVSNGLGLSIPMDIPIEAYLEIATDFRPHIRKAVSETIERSGTTRTESGAAAIAKEVMRLNAEIESVRGTGRQIFLDACVDFYVENSGMVNAALMAGAFGLAGGVAGCIGGPAAAAGVGAAASSITTVAKKKDWIKPSKGSDRLARTVQSGIQPYVDKLVSLYVGASTPAVSVMSLRTRIDRSAGKARSRAGAVAKPAQQMNRSPSSRRLSQKTR